MWLMSKEEIVVVVFFWGRDFVGECGSLGVCWVSRVLKIWGEVWVL